MNWEKLIALILALLEAYKERQGAPKGAAADPALESLANDTLDKAGL